MTAMPNRKPPPRPKGDRSIRPRWSRRDERWLYDVTYPRWSRGHLTLDDARAVRDGMRVDNRRGALGRAPARMTVSDLVTKHWLPAKQAELTNKHSLAGAKTAAGHIVAGLGAIQLTKLTPNDVERWKRSLATKGYASTTAALIFHRFKEVLKWAVEHELIYHNASAPVKAPRVTKHELPAMDLDDIRRLLEVADASKHGLPVYLALRTGLREESELFSLTWAQIDLRAGTARVAAKTPSGKRTVALSPAVVVRLQQHRQAQIAEYYRHDLPPPPHVLYDEKGRTWTTQRYWWRWNAIRTEARLPTLRFHDLRHVQATLLSAAGVNVKVAQAVLGHARAQTTMDIYTHLLGDPQPAAAAAVEALLDGRS